MRHRSERSLLACAVALAALALPAPAGATPKAIWGPVALPDGSSAFPTYAELGVDVLQLQLIWSRVAPEEPARATDPDDPAYRWPAAIGAAIAAGAEHGIEVALLVRGSPAWTVGEPAIGATAEATAPLDPADYADFLTAAARRFPEVPRWMIWGEPNRRAQWASGPVAYADLLDAAYGAVKAVDPSDVVVGGMSTSFGDVPTATWVAALRRSDGRPPRLDEYGHNPFTHRCPDLALAPDPGSPGARDISDLDTLAGELRDSLGADVPLWLSEFTVSSDRASWALPFHVSRERQAEWLTRAFAIASSLDHVSGIGWFNLHDGPPPDGLTTGLMTHAGERKPAFAAYRDASLAGGVQPGACYPSAPAAAGDPAPAGPAIVERSPSPAAGRPARPPLALAVRAPRRGRLAAVLRRGLRVRARCDRDCAIAAVLMLGRRQARALGIGRGRRRVVARARGHGARAGALALRPGRRVARRLRDRRRVRMNLSVVARASSGEVRRIRRPVVLR